MVIRSLARSVAFGASLTLIGAAKAGGWTAQAALTGPQVVPPTASTGQGLLSVSYDGLGLITCSLVYSDLQGGITGATINQGKVGVNGPVLFTLLLSDPGSLSGTAIGSDAITAAQANTMISGGDYVTIQSKGFASGEIRGQIVNTVPEPAPIAVVAVGTLGLLFRRRTVRR